MYPGGSPSFSSMKPPHAVETQRSRLHFPSPSTLTRSLQDRSKYLTLTVGFEGQLEARSLIRCIRHKADEEVAIGGLEEGWGASTTDTIPQRWSRTIWTISQLWEQKFVNKCNMIFSVVCSLSRPSQSKVQSLVMFWWLISLIHSLRGIHKKLASGRALSSFILRRRGVL